ncbi:hypothetical protein [Halobacteriovorax sp. RT-1-4]|uniref:hypothetical protein n=2 Tax=unclassified Halobacteriovorax TaxID=2639665 RepID=UPI0039995497
MQLMTYSLFKSLIFSLFGAIAYSTRIEIIDFIGRIQYKKIYMFLIFWGVTTVLLFIKDLLPAKNYHVVEEGSFNIDLTQMKGNSRILSYSRSNENGKVYGILKFEIIPDKDMDKLSSLLITNVKFRVTPAEKPSFEVFFDEEFRRCIVLFKVHFTQWIVGQDEKIVISFDYLLEAYDFKSKFLKRIINIVSRNGFRKKNNRR